VTHPNAPERREDERVTITARFLGGPRDGEGVELADLGPHTVVMPRPTRDVSSDQDHEPMPFDIVTLVPVLTRDGWVLPWHEP